MANLVAQMEQALNELKAKEAKIKEAEERLKNEKEWVVNNQLKKEKKIKLNVGGIYHTTTLTTLKSDPDSMLAAMFSGRFPIGKDEDDGAYFLDRDGHVFGHILTWLRIGELPPKLSEEELFLLKKEAEYFQLAKLSAILQSASRSKKDKRDVVCLRFDTWKEKEYQAYVQEAKRKWAEDPNHHGGYFTEPNRCSQKFTHHDWFEQEVSVWIKKGYTIIHKEFEYPTSQQNCVFVMLAAKLPNVPRKPTCIAICDYKANRISELSFKKGTVITIIQKCSDW